MGSYPIHGEKAYFIDEQTVIGEGGFGVLYKGTHIQSQETVAIKRLKLDTEKRMDSDNLSLQRHIDIHS